MSGRDDRGAVTVETAIALLSLVAVLGALCFGMAAVTAQLRCVDAAREAARLAARGDAERVGSAVGRTAPPGARWELRWDAVGVTAIVHAEPAGGLVPGVHIRGEAFAVAEPGVGTQDERSAEGG